MEIEEKVLKLIKSRKKGILQNELWKKADIDRRKCSRIIEKLEKEGKITREQQSNNGKRTYLVKFTEKKKEIARNFKLLMVSDLFAPCTGCVMECVPDGCLPLSEWVLLLADEK